MTENREFYAATVQEAVEKAAAALNLESGEMDFEVIDEGSAGFLGIGARDARISVYSPAVVPAQVDAADVAAERAPDETEVDVDAESLPAAELEIETAGSSESAVAVDEEPGTPEPVPDEIVLAADGFMTELIELMGFDGTVDVHDSGESIVVDVSSAQTGLFIGQKGETIDAIQYLLNVSVYKNRPFAKRIVVDTEGYRQRRVEAIQGMAHRIARRAQREKRPVSLPPMSAAERRVVHLFLKENPRVSTSSEGQDEDRRVVVAPI